MENGEGRVDSSSFFLYLNKYWRKSTGRYIRGLGRYLFSFHQSDAFASVVSLAFISQPWMVKSQLLRVSPSPFIYHCAIAGKRLRACPGNVWVRLIAFHLLALLASLQLTLYSLASSGFYLYRGKQNIKILKQ